MSTSLDFLGSLQSGVSFTDIMGAIRDIYGGGASHRIADVMGFTLRSGQRYLKDEQHPTTPEARARFTTLRAEAEEHLTAGLIRLIDTIDAGTVTVILLSVTPHDEDGDRNIGEVDNLGPGMDRVADLWEAGFKQAAADAFDAAVIARYAGESADDAHGLASVLGIIDYKDGINY